MPRRPRAASLQVTPYCASELLALDPLPPEQLALAFAEWHPLRFVVKRHRAAELHTDFRLEAYGRLLSWSADGLPSLDPARALDLGEQPDHDLKGLLTERRAPEGRTGPGRTGSGPTIVWDHGTFRPLAPGPLTPGRATVEALRRGKLNFWVEGARLRGAFRLEIGRGGWRLVKIADAHASTAPPPGDLSVLTGRGLDAAPAPRAPRRERETTLTLDL